MSEIPGVPVGHEAYSFACLRCGHGWEQAYEIEHHTDAAGRDFVVYRTDGRRVSSPLVKSTCPNCGHHSVRIMGSGRISGISGILAPGGPEARGSGATGAGATGATGASGAGATGAGATGATGASGAGATGASGQEPERRRRSSLLHPFHRD
ncbi:MULTISPECIES: hypothetical protein [Streptomyces]|uniref:C2H2-type domain-containing protein n=2 Tax=Streptomyces fradiae TaxID=1906 RepID=A0A1Y2NM46_STRFR|nr:MULTISPECIES: hypothetical protein [Streptomyces]KAF0646994.1 hypothetical protein K701_25460 [Streptomyces fradiae ATCC 10745 = DSM 40063]OSY48572.1 hypothetical protein BG846_05822 [Streptomyces fradiae ATCC 10745 = DSM 40063]QEV12614.1 hypothetical protein CP974_11980 [Streptomyces fradiae ATCC 10745 = DSM 40063]